MTIGTVYLAAALLATPATLFVLKRFHSLRQQLDKTQHQLHQSQKLASIGQLTSGIAHDINNLLGIVTGNLDLLEDLVAHNESALERTQSARKAADLGRRLLAFSSTQQFNPISTPLEDPVRNALEIAIHTLGPKITISTNLATLPPVFIDPTSLESALLNLFLNARDAMPNHSASLHIATQSIHIDATHHYVLNGPLQPGPYALISVADNGHGMTKETLIRVFEPFFTTKDHTRGTGLGLAMVYDFIRQSKGHIHIDSKLNHGTTVSLYLPFAKKALQPALETLTHHKPLTSSRKILLVDDEADLLDITSAYLRKLGYRTLQARDFAQAINLITKHPDIDLLLTDILLPSGSNGVDLAQYVQTLRPSISILYTSGFPTDALVEKHLPIANHTLLKKPYRLSELTAAIHRAMDEERKPTLAIACSAGAVACSTGLAGAFRPLKLAGQKGALALDRTDTTLTA